MDSGFRLDSGPEISFPGLRADVIKLFKAVSYEFL